jgi:predicted RNA-binding Zn ribbon-like protein
VNLMPEPDGPKFKFVGGQLALDFVNTVDWEDGNVLRSERLNTYADLVDWSVAAGIIPAYGARSLAKEAASRPKPADAALAEAVVLRRVLRGIFASLAAGRKPASAEVDSFNNALQEAFEHLYLEPSGKGMTWSWDHRGLDFNRLTWPVAWAAAALLTSGELDRLRECAGSSCGWLFLDQSRNGSRRWCDMKVCGNVVKARRHYARKRIELLRD